MDWDVTIKERKQTPSLKWLDGPRWLVKPLEEKQRQIRNLAFASKIGHKSCVPVVVLHEFRTDFEKINAQHAVRVQTKETELREGLLRMT